MLPDQKELLRLFNAHGVRYLTVGGHAVSLHGEPRGTKDLDLLIASDEANSLLVYRALAEFGAPLAGVSASDFVGHEEMVFQLGVAPSRVDLMQSISGVSFEAAWERRVESFADGELPMHVISEEDLIANKLATGRLQDLADVKKIRKAIQSRLTGTTPT